LNLLPRRAVLAIAAVVDVALYAGPMRVASRALTARHNLSPRHLELLLPGLVQAKILKGTRGSRGGYQLARVRRKIMAGEIVRTALALSTAAPIGARSELFQKVIEPSIRKAGDGFLAKLDALTVEDLCDEVVEAARELLGMSQEALANVSRVSRSTIIAFEKRKILPRYNTVDAIRRALEVAGVEFTNGGEPGVKLRKEP
jgi:Rrf2 family iron-sulfur cluster assembly transcriptional regulator